MVGYSRLVAADETGTLARLKAFRADLIDPKIAQHQGRIVKEIGDGLLVEFASRIRLPLLEGSDRIRPTPQNAFRLIWDVNHLVGPGQGRVNASLNSFTK